MRKGKEKANKSKGGEKKETIVKLCNHRGKPNHVDIIVHKFCESTGMKVKLVPGTGWCGYDVCATLLNCARGDVLALMPEGDKKKSLIAHHKKELSGLDTKDYIVDDEIHHIMKSQKKPYVMLMPEDGGLNARCVNADGVEDWVMSMKDEQGFAKVKDLTNFMVFNGKDHFDLILHKSPRAQTQSLPSSEGDGISSAVGDVDDSVPRGQKRKPLDGESGPVKPNLKRCRITKVFRAFPLDRPRYVGDKDIHRYNDIVPREWHNVEFRNRSGFHTKQKWTRVSPPTLNIVPPKGGEGCAVTIMCFLSGTQPLAPSMKGFLQDSSLRDLKTMLKPEWLLQTVRTTPSCPFFLFRMEPGMYLVGTLLTIRGKEHPHWIGYDGFRRAIYPGFGALIKIEEKEFIEDSKVVRRNANKVFRDLGLGGIVCCAVLLKLI